MSVALCSVPHMTNDLANTFLQAFLDGIPFAMTAFVQAFQAQPWPWIAILAVTLVGVFMPTAKRRRRRA